MVLWWWKWLWLQDWHHKYPSLPTPGPILRANWAGHPRPDFQCHFWHRVQVIWCVLVSNDNFRLVLRTKMCLNSILIIFSNLWVPSATCPIWELACSKFWGLPWCQDGNVRKIAFRKFLLYCPSQEPTTDTTAASPQHIRWQSHCYIHIPLGGKLVCPGIPDHGPNFCRKMGPILRSITAPEVCRDFSLQILAVLLGSVLWSRLCLRTSHWW